ncbi:MAG: TIGR04222 domain-containing membrane protein [Janthinobacterium lividum]
MHNHPQPLTAHAELWAKLEVLDLDGAAQLSFSRRLARDNGWPPAFAERVVLEYKRFVYLAATCGHPVTPSDEVDQAWHLHLVYTRSYWDELCGQVLGFALHHGPTKGGAAEGQKFEDWYERTRQSYRAAFGTAPPADIWPPAAVRFGEASYFRRVNMRRKWLVPKPQWRKLLRYRPWLALVGLLVLAGCTARTPLNPLNWYGPEFLGLYWTLCLTVLPLALWLRHRGRGPLADYHGPQLGTYELVRLADQGERLVDSALAALAYANAIKLLPGQLVRHATPTPPQDPYERTVWSFIPPSGGTANLASLRERATRPDLAVVSSLDQSLEARGLLLPAQERRRLNRIPTLALVALVLFGLAKLLVGLSRGRPVGFLFITLVVLVIGGIYVCSRQKAWATGQGASTLQHATTAFRKPNTSLLSAQAIALTVALMGVTSLTALGQEPLATFFAPPPSPGGGSDGGSGCGSSGCGGGGCGGGCGGCGS